MEGSFCRLCALDHATELDKHVMATSFDIGCGRVQGFFTGGRPDLCRFGVEQAIAPVAGLQSLQANGRAIEWERTASISCCTASAVVLGGVGDLTRTIMRAVTCEVRHARAAAERHRRPSHSLQLRDHAAGSSFARPAQVEAMQKASTLRHNK
jgi:hypothetical protein